MQPAALSLKDQLLTRAKISLTKPALVGALGSSDPEVRWLAALKLAEMKEVSAIPDISAALRNTGIASSQGLKIASALVSLGSREGRQAMSNFCNDPRGALQLWVTAAAYLLQIGDEVCFQVVVEALQKPADDDVRMMALSLVRSSRTPRRTSVRRLDSSGRGSFQIEVRALG